MSKFIVFEGIDSEVVAEQARRMADWLRDEGLRVVVTREPTDGPIGAQIRLVLNGRLQMDEHAKAVLFLADRLDHLHRPEDGILPELEKGNYVVCIRYLLSAYTQSQEVDPEWLEQINRLCPWPDLMIFVDTPVGTALDRLVKQEGYDEERTQKKEQELEALRQAYLRAVERCQEEGKSVQTVDGNQTAAAIHRQCRKWAERVMERASR